MHRDDADLTDEALRDEIELVASLVVAASGCPGRMQREELDSILGVPQVSLLSKEQVTTA
ncbi:hypothetical protein [Lapillicoccus sp.]|uniref:hypothetical protein n=1 Tax=Lapillicoccus sp. TaxID=1909287 RepID=UPI0027D07562|nr:hypothetical protein [Actinomycetota bacterium]